MCRRLTQLIVALLLVLAVGGQWAMLQSAAWIGMAITYSQIDPLPVALKKTFDGKHPCQLCLTVSKGLAKEKSPEGKIQISKLELLFDGDAARVFPPVMHLLRRPFDLSHANWADAPPTPPPIFA